MTDFVLLARIEEVVPGQFRVTVVAARHHPVLEVQPADAVTSVCASSDEAEAWTEAQLHRMAQRLRVQGHVILDVRRERRDPFDEERRLNR
jgi:hypothetical protein